MLNCEPANWWRLDCLDRRCVVGFRCQSGSEQVNRKEDTYPLEQPGRVILRGCERGHRAKNGEMVSVCHIEVSMEGENDNRAFTITLHKSHNCSWRRDCFTPLYCSFPCFQQTRRLSHSCAAEIGAAQKSVVCKAPLHSDAERRLDSGREEL